MENNVKKRLKDLRSMQGELSNKLSSLVLQTIVIFGVPALLGYFMGVYLEGRGVTKVFAYTLPLILTFSFSWFILLRKLNRLKREVEKVESEIRELAPPKIEEIEGQEDLDRDLK